MTTFSPTVSIANGQVLRLSIRVEDTMWVGFDRLNVYRSRTGVAGPYTALTGDSWEPARLLIYARPYVVNGRTLSLLVDERTRLDITFSGADPLSAAAIATQIQAQGLGIVTAEENASFVVISTVRHGAAASLRVLPSDAAGIFNLEMEEPGAVSFGVDAQLPLISGVGLYVFDDPHGLGAYFYRTRFRNSLTQGTSEYSAPFAGSITSLVDPARLVLGTVDLVDISGKPAVNVRVMVGNKFPGLFLADVGVMGGVLDTLTDSNGHAEFVLLRGSTVTLSIAGTSLARDILVPVDPAITSFHLLAPAVGGQDVFTVQVPNIEYAVRRTL